MSIVDWNSIDWEVIGAYAGLVVAGIELLRFGSKLIGDKPTVELRLLEDVYFRLSPLGETMFNNFTLINRGSLIELRKLSLQIQKLGSKNNTKLDFSMKYIGEKSGQIENSHIKDNLFDSTSVAEFLPKDTMIKKILASTTEEYSDKIKDTLADFEGELNDLRQQALQEEELVKEIGILVNKYKGILLPLLKLENAEYLIVLTAECRPTSWFWRLFYKKGVVKKPSKIKMVLKNIDSYHQDLEIYLWNFAIKKMQGNTNDLAYPTIFPHSVAEVD
jgi:hypothetical protein